MKQRFPTAHVLLSDERSAAEAGNDGDGVPALLPYELLTDLAMDSLKVFENSTLIEGEMSAYGGISMAHWIVKIFENDSTGSGKSIFKN